MRVNPKAIIVVFVLFFFLEPDFIKSIPILHQLFNIARLVSLFAMALFMIIKSQFLHVSFVVAIYYLIYVFSTYINDGSTLGVISDGIPILGFVMCVELLLSRYPLKGLQLLNFVYSSLVYLNLLFLLIYPDGYMQHYSGVSLVSRYFLGVPNQFASILIPAAIVSVVYSIYKYKKLRLNTIILLIAIFMTFIYFWSATSLVGITIIVVCLLLINQSIFGRMINNKTVFLSIILLFVIVVLLNNLNLFSLVIEGLLKKDLTLSTRTEIWDISQMMIKESFFWGYGFVEEGRYIYFSEWKQRDAHNTLLQILLQTGVLGLGTFIYLFIQFYFKMSKNKTHVLSKFILIAIFASTTMMLTEVYRTNFLYLVLLIGIYMPSMISRKDKKSYC